MSVNRCYICDQNPRDKRRYGEEGLVAGQECPICYEPVCRYHLATVRWRWKNNGHVESAQICRECQRSYRHRSWDTLNRDWIS
jgi:hypothetical protein